MKSSGVASRLAAPWSADRLRLLRAQAAVPLRQLAGGLGTGTLALLVLAGLVIAAVTSVVGIGLLLARPMLGALHALADRERARLSRWGPEIVRPVAGPTRIRAAAADPVTQRELSWLVRHATGGLLVGLGAMLLPLLAFRDMTLLFYWWLLPTGDATASLWIWEVTDWPNAIGVFVLGIGLAATTWWVTPTLAIWQERPGRRLLSPGAETDLPLRVAELTATRAAALDAHATELRRIERSLHDSTQNPLVAVTVLVGAARRSLLRDPAAADEMLERAQSAAEQALTELRSISRTILPPVIDDHGLSGALTSLAASSPVPCQIEIDVPRRCAVSVEAAAYFVVSEALTNVARHSGAHHTHVAVVTRGSRLHVRISDDGIGGADASAGSGLSGIRRRVEAHDGTLQLTSPAGGPTILEVDLPCGS